MSKANPVDRSDVEIRLFERMNRHPDLWLAEREVKVKVMIEGNAIRGFGPLVHHVEYDGATTWRTRNDNEGHHSG